MQAHDCYALSCHCNHKGCNKASSLDRSQPVAKAPDAQALPRFSKVSNGGLLVLHPWQVSHFAVCMNFSCNTIAGACWTGHVGDMIGPQAMSCRAHDNMLPEALTVFEGLSKLATIHHELLGYTAPQHTGAPGPSLGI